MTSLAGLVIAAASPGERDHGRAHVAGRHRDQAQPARGPPGWVADDRVAEEAAVNEQQRRAHRPATGIGEPARVPRNQANPASASSGPTLLRGRRDQPASPHPISAHPTARSARVAATFCFGAASHSATGPSAKPAGQAALLSSAGRLVMPSRDQRADRKARQLTLGDETADRAAGQPPAVGRDIPRRYQHHRR